MAEVWFGTRNYMQWISAPSVDVGASKRGFSGQVGFLSGGAYVRRSKAAAKTFAMSWGVRTRAQVQPILDYADGVYGNGPLYYCNPFAMPLNMLPAYWASPSINYYDGPAIVDGIRPELVTNLTSTNGYPVESAIYALTSSSSIPSIYLPIPPGYTMHIGAHGSVVSGTASVTVTPEVNAISSGPTSNLTLLDTTTTTRTNFTVEGDSYAGVTISMASLSSGQIQLDGLIAQCLPNSATPTLGGFISGQGQSGLSFVEQPTVSEYSYAFDRVGVSADLIETEAWLWA